MKTKAAVAYAAGKPLEVTTVELDGPRAGEVLVEIKATGICHTDEFTRSGADPVPAAWRWRAGDPEGCIAGGVHASFLHTHPAGRPDAVSRFAAATIMYSRSTAGGATVQ